MDDAISRCLVLSPQDEGIILSSVSIENERLKEEWRRFNQGREYPISLSAFILHKRIDRYRNKLVVQRVYKRFKGLHGSHQQAVLLCYNFVTHLNRYMILEKDMNALYGVPLDEAIVIQEDLLFELLDLDVYKKEDIAIFFYHDPRKSYTLLSNNKVLLHRYSVWISSLQDAYVALSHDVEATFSDVSISSEILVRDNVLYDKEIHQQYYSCARLIQRRPYIFKHIYPGTSLCCTEIVLSTSEIEMKKVYASRIMYLIDRDKLPSGWDNLLLMHQNGNDSIFRDGSYPVRNISSDLIGTNRDSTLMNIWYEIKTVFTLSAFSRRYPCDLQIIY